MQRSALDAIAEDEEAAASIGINVSRRKLAITLLSAGLTCVIAGGMAVVLGPTVGAVLLLACPRACASRSATTWRTSTA